MKLLPLLLFLVLRERYSRLECDQRRSLKLMIHILSTRRKLYFILFLYKLSFAQLLKFLLFRIPRMGRRTAFVFIYLCFAPICLSIHSAEHCMCNNYNSVSDMLLFVMFGKLSIVYIPLINLNIILFVFFRALQLVSVVGWCALINE